MTTPTIEDETTERAGLVDLTTRMADDLVAFGRFVADHPDLPVPTQDTVYRNDDGIHARFDIYVSKYEDDAPAEMARIARVLADGAPKGGVVKVQDHYFRLQRRFGSVLLEVWTTRDAVCERVQVGTETIETPDPEALAAVPTVTEERPVYEWRCAPILQEAHS